MKYLINNSESWYNECLVGISDMGFAISYNGGEIIAKYKGDIDVLNLTDSYAEAISRISEIKEIISSDIRYNLSTGNAYIKIVTTPKEYILINVDGESKKYFICNLLTAYYTTSGNFRIIIINGVIDKKKSKLEIFVKKDDNYIKIRNKTLDTQAINHKEIDKLLTIFKSGVIKDTEGDEILDFEYGYLESCLSDLKKIK